MNCHYVSRSLTRSWETDRGELIFYDFATRTINLESSKSLFARPDLNSPEVEKWLGAKVEAPLGRFLKLRRKTRAWSPNIRDWEVYQALVLLIPLQIARIARARSRAAALDQIFQWSAAELGTFVASFRSVYSLAIVQGHPACPLFVPEQGFFPVPLPGASSATAAANAVPISATEAIMVMPRSMDRRAIKRTLTQGQGFYLNNCSLGTNADRVVIHPAIVDSMSPTALIAEIEATRARNVDCYRTALRLLGSGLSASFAQRT